ncbi:hypothetical protein SAMN05216359_102595 [Roseateles sp. YR242]|uniref:hypothetical protein n=1 Tax=Roseateles sp. YR242 TaxID=1855305 RepID=UPI0008BF5ADA|nr:hypothetical protein [Roseateles sp. YR242]SEK66300.1 hypothetical protein SAMN05216359_102595 [Roseateles sp. YR242]
MNASALAHVDHAAHAPALSPATDPVAQASSVVMSLCFRAEDVQACRQARRWSDAAMAQLAGLAQLTNPVDDELAEVALRRAIAEDPCEVEAFAGLTALLSRQGRHDEALEAVDQALGWCSNVALLHFHAGCALSAAGRVADAIASHHRALGLDATLADAHYELGLLYEEIGEPRFSARHFRAYSRVQQQPAHGAEVASSSKALQPADLLN